MAEFLESKRKDEVLVSVCVITYNQEAYIERCLQSILDQIVDFDIEIIVGEDNSTDGTRAIVQKFVDKYPDKLKPIFHRMNVGGCANYVAVHKAAIGKYVAHLDGDDYCSPNKLQTQVRYLDAESECVAVFHRMATCNNDGTLKDDDWPKNFVNEKYDFSSAILNLSDFVHSSMMYRRGLLDDFFALNIPQFIDYQIYIHLASKGELSCIEDILGVYRLGVGFSMTTSVRELMVQALVYGYKFNRDTDSVNLAVADKCMMLSKVAFVGKDLAMYRKLIRMSVHAKLLGLNQFVLYAFSYMPWALNFLYSVRKYWRELLFVSFRA